MPCSETQNFVTALQGDLAREQKLSASLSPLLASDEVGIFFVASQVPMLHCLTCLTSCFLNSLFLCCLNAVLLYILNEVYLGSACFQFCRGNSPGICY